MTILSMAPVLAEDSESVRPRAAPADRALPCPELTVVVPTFNERDNVAVLAGRLAQALAGLDWEAIFVDDDSADGTMASVRELGRGDGRIRGIRRIRRRAEHLVLTHEIDRRCERQDSNGDYKDRKRLTPHRRII